MSADLRDTVVRLWAARSELPWKAILAGLGALLAASIWVAFWYNAGKVDRLESDLSKAEAAATQLEGQLAAEKRNIKVSREVVVQVVKEKGEIRYLAAKRQEKVDKALENAPEWASTPIPEEVRNALDY